MRTLFFYLLTILTASAAFAQNIYEQAVQEADRQQLSEDPYWESLLHFKEGWISNYRSLIDDPRFFLAEDGKHDKHAELNATIQKLLEEQGESDDFAQCRFPARTRWLSDKLSILRDNLPAVTCTYYDTVTTRIAPARVSMIFPFYNMGGPGSMFGHTMLRIEKADSTPLLGYAVTYAADTQGAGPMKYVFFGIFGGFDGVYSVLPYSQKLNEYAHIESRDVWEYTLNLDEEESRRLYDHVWEMSLVRSDYYFFDENCAYNLLFLIEAARPGLKLTDGYTAVLPIDTIKAVAAAKLVQNVNYRPSNMKRMRAMAATLDSQEISTAREIAQGTIAPSEVHLLNSTDENKAAIMDLAGELVWYYNLREDPAVYRRLTISTLSERAKIAAKNEYKVSQPSSPENGHGTTKIALAGGYAYDSAYFQTDLRLSYHALEDNSLGFMDTNTVAGDLRLRYYADSQRMGIERATLLDIQNLSPYEPLFRPLSWMVSTGIDDRSVNADSSFRVYYLNGGAGLTFSPNTALMFWLMPTLEAQYQEEDPYELSIGIGMRAGALLHTGSFGKFVMDARYLQYSDSSEHVESTASISYAYYLAQNHSLTAGIKYQRLYDADGSDLSVKYNYFF